MAVEVAEKRYIFNFIWILEIWSIGKDLEGTAAAGGDIEYGIFLTWQYSVI